MKSKLIFGMTPIISALLTAITLPVMAWFFSQEDIGFYSLIQVSVMLATIVVTLGMDQAYVREFNSRLGPKNLFFNHIISSTLVFFLMVLFTFFFIEFANTELVEGQNHFLIYLFTIAVGLTVFINYMTVHFRLCDSPYGFMAGQVVSKASFIIILLIMIFNEYLTNDINSILIVLVSSQFFSAFFLVFFVKAGRNVLTNKFSIQLEYISKTLKYAIPIMLGSLLLWLTLAADRFLLNSLSSLNDVALYSVAFTVASVGMLVQSIFSMLWFPEAYKEFEETGKYDRINDTTGQVLVVVVLVFILISILSPMVMLFLPDSYEDVKYILVGLLIYPLLLVLSEVSGIGLGFRRRTGLNLIAMLLAFMINLISNFYLIPELGAIGAAVSSAIAFFAYLVLKTEFSSFVWGSINRGKIYGFSILMLVIVVFYVLTKSYDFLVLSCIFLFFIALVILKKDFFSLGLLVKTLRVNKVV